MIWSYRFIKREIRELQEKARSLSPAFCSLQKAKTLIVLYPEKEKEKILDAVKELEAEGKQVLLCQYGESSICTDEAVAFHLSLVCDVNRWAFPSAEKLQAWQQLSADMLIDLTRGENPIAQYLLLKHDAVCKVGIKTEKSVPYHVAVMPTETSQDTAFFIRADSFLFTDYFF